MPETPFVGLTPKPASQWAVAGAPGGEVQHPRTTQCLAVTWSPGVVGSSPQHLPWMSAHQEGASRGAPVDSVVALHSKRRTCTHGEERRGYHRCGAEQQPQDVEYTRGRSRIEPWPTSRWSLSRRHQRLHALAAPR